MRHQFGASIDFSQADCISTSVCFFSPPVETLKFWGKPSIISTAITFKGVLYCMQCCHDMWLWMECGNNGTHQDDASNASNDLLKAWQEEWARQVQYIGKVNKPSSFSKLQTLLRAVLFCFGAKVLVWSTARTLPLLGGIDANRFRKSLSWIFSKKRGDWSPTPALTTHPSTSSGSFIRLSTSRDDTKPNKTGLMVVRSKRDLPRSSWVLSKTASRPYGPHVRISLTPTTSYKICRVAFILLKLKCIQKNNTFFLILTQKKTLFLKT